MGARSMNQRLYEIWRVTLRATPAGVVRESACLGREECRWRAAALAREQDTLAQVTPLFGRAVLYSNGKEPAHE